MEDVIRQFFEESKKRNEESKEFLKQLHLKGSIKSIDSIETGNIDALVTLDKNELKIYSESTGDSIYRILIEKMNEGAVTLNESGIIIYCNSHFASLVNLPLQDLSGRMFKDLITGSSKKFFASFLSQGRKKAVKEEVCIQAGNGSKIPVQISINTFLFNDVTFSSIIVTDLTNQIKAREELKNKSVELNKHNIELGKANKELHFQHKENEKQTAELLTLTKDLTSQQKLLKRAHHELNKKTILLQQQGEKVVRINEDLQNLNRHLEKRVTERTGELKKLNEELKDINLSKDKLFSVISHDLQNPLSALSMSSGLLSDRIEHHRFREVRPLVEIIHRTSNKVLQQLNELVEWVQIQQGAPTLNIRKLHLAPEIDKSLGLLIEIAAQKKILLENKVATDIYVNANFIMLRSVVQNLVTNAIKFTEQGGLITVTSKAVDKMIEISVIDSGIGMKKTMKKNLFINHDSASGTNNEKGTGLGLVLAKDFINKQGGTIRVESKFGKGSCLIFTVPEWYSNEAQKAGG